MDRRTFLASAAGLAAAGPAAAGLRADAPVLGDAIDGAELGALDGRLANHSGVVQRLLDEASQTNREVVLPAGSFIVGDIRLPPRVRLSGVAGATRLVFGGGSHMFTGDQCEVVSLRNLVFDGAGEPLDTYVSGIVHLTNAADVTVDGCLFAGSAESGLALDRCGGRVMRSTFRDCAVAGIRSIEATGLSITDNVVEDCGNAGIKVFRWTDGEDGTIVTGNRIARIRADGGGTGQNGNGINVFRAANVIVANNRIGGAAFSAVRANSASNVQIVGNNCSTSGETAIYSEFSFEGAVVANNLIDGAANGIGIVNFNEGGRVATVTGNIVRNLSAVGPYPAPRPQDRFGNGIAVEADTAVTGNVVEGAPRFGVTLGFGPFLRDVTASGNVIRDTEVGIAVTVVEGAGAAVISDNVISGARRGAIVGTRWRDQVSGDLTGADAEAYTHLQIERNRVR